MKEGPAKAVPWQIFCFLILGGAWAGGSCSIERVGNDSSAAATTGPIGATMTAGAYLVGSSNGGYAPCIGGAPDGHCDVLGGEGCYCEDCAVTAFCKQEDCRLDVDAGDCEPTLDACTCPQCDTNHYCNNPTQSNCIPDGTCDTRYEGCTCEDCKSNNYCTDNVDKCTKAQPGAGCEDPEMCECVDCFGAPSCVLPCTDDGGCDSSESCACPDCRETDYCTDLDRCKDDGICDIIVEGCVCADCKGISPECASRSDAGTMAQSGASAASGAGGGM